MKYKYAGSGSWGQLQGRPGNPYCLVRKPTSSSGTNTHIYPQITSEHSCLHSTILPVFLLPSLHLFILPFVHSTNHSSIPSNCSFIHSSFLSSFLPSIFPSFLLVFLSIQPPIYPSIYSSILYHYILPFNIYPSFLPLSCPSFLPSLFLQHIHPSIFPFSLLPSIHLSNHSFFHFSICLPILAI